VSDRQRVSDLAQACALLNPGLIGGSGLTMDTGAAACTGATEDLCCRAVRG
jgi:hypothetical protein